MSMHKNVLTLCCAAAFALGLAACSSSDDPPPPPPPPPPVDTGPTAYEAGKAAIMAAMTADDAQAAYDAIDQTAITGEQASTLMDLLDDQLEMIATAGREADQKMALMNAADAIDTTDLSTQALVDAARMAIADLRQALTDAADVSEADKMMYMSTLNDAVDAVDMAQGGLDTDTRRANQMTALSNASMDLQTALAALSGSTPTQAQLDAANNALADLNAAIMGGGDLTDTEKAPYQREANNAMAPIQSAQMVFDDAEDDADDKANQAMAATAAKLYAGLSMRETTDGATTRNAAYSGTNDSQITVTIGAFQADGTTAVSPTPTHTLSEDDKTMVADNYGWEGTRYVDPAGGAMVEAVVYSMPGDPTEGDPFNEEYTLLTTATATVMVGEVGVDTSTEAVQMRVASSRFDQSAGTKEFELPANTVRVGIMGSYHGVSGTFYCTPAANNACASQVAADGFLLGGTADDTNAFTAGGGTWAFKPGNPEAKVTSVPDSAYASYGWWIRKAANDGPFTASAFVDFKGADGTLDVIGDIIDALNGTATYMGGAAGKYALASSTGGTNDAGHFTARAMLEADFTDNTDAMAITGTLDMFMGADDQPRDWMVELGGSAIANGGSFGDATDGTVWTIDGTAAGADGQWSGQLYDTADNGVPAVATGTFYSTFGTAGKMVGAFGANTQ